MPLGQPSPCPSVNSPPLPSCARSRNNTENTLEIRARVDFHQRERKRERARAESFRPPPLRECSASKLGGLHPLGNSVLSRAPSRENRSYHLLPLSTPSNSLLLLRFHSLLVHSSRASCPAPSSRARVLRIVGDLKNNGRRRQGTCVCADKRVKREV